MTLLSFHGPISSVGLGLFGSETKLLGRSKKFKSLDSNPNDFARASCKIRIDDLPPYSEQLMWLII